MSHGLSADAAHRITTVFSRHPEIEKAVLYGSRAKGDFRNGSDIDLTLFGGSVSRDVLSQVNEELDNLLLPHKIDLSIFSELTHPELIDHIKRVGVVFYERTPVEVKR